MTPLTKKAQEVLTKLVKTSGVVDRTIGEINELQWGYRHMRAPFSEANATSRNVNYMNDYFAKQSALIPGGDKGKAAKAGKTPKDFPKKLIQQGMKVESEHTSSKPIQKEITTDHLTEDKEYYIKLKKMEKAGALLRDVDSRNKIIQNAKDRGALAGSAVGASVALLLARKRKYKSLAGALGVVPGFFAGSALTGAAVSAYQGAQDLRKQAHNMSLAKATQPIGKVGDDAWKAYTKNEEFHKLLDSAYKQSKNRKTYNKYIRPLGKPVLYAGAALGVAGAVHSLAHQNKKLDTDKHLGRNVAAGTLAASGIIPFMSMKRLGERLDAELLVNKTLKLDASANKIVSEYPRMMGRRLALAGGLAGTGFLMMKYKDKNKNLKKQALFLDKFPKIRKGLATAMTAGALAAPAKGGGLTDLAKAIEVDIPKLEHRSSQVFYHKPESPTAQKYVLDAGLKGKHWVASDTSRTTLPSGAEKRHIETMLLNQEGGTDSRMVVKEIVNPKTPGLVNRESWVKPIKYEEAKSYLDMKKTLAAK